MERRLLGALLYNREAYEVLAPIIDEKNDFSEHGKLIYQQISRCYKNDLALKSCDKDLLIMHFHTAIPKHAELFEKVLNELQEHSVSNLIDFFVEYKKDRIGTQLAEALLSPANKRTDDLLQQYVHCSDVMSKKFQDEEQEAVDMDNLADLVEEFKPENLIQIYPKSVGEALGGGVPRGTHILVYGTPDSGKTALAISIAAGFLVTGRRVLYIGNEDSKRLIAMRFYSRLSGKDRTQVMMDLEGAKKLAYDRGLNNLVFVPRSPGHISELPKLIEKYKPDCLVIDQLHNLRHYNNLSKVERLEALAYEVRNVVKEHDIVGVSLTQAADSAYGKLVLDMDDVYYSNIAVQANVDIMLGLGWNNEYQQLNKRMITVTKNKMNDFHGSIPVDITPAISRVS